MALNHSPSPLPTSSFRLLSDFLKAPRRIERRFKVLVGWAFLWGGYTFISNYTNKLLFMSMLPGDVSISTVELWVLLSYALTAFLTTCGFGYLLLFRFQEHFSEENFTNGHFIIIVLMAIIVINLQFAFWDTFFGLEYSFTAHVMYAVIFGTLPILIMATTYKFSSKPIAKSPHPVIPGQNLPVFHDTRDINSAHFNIGLLTFRENDREFLQLHPHQLHVVKAQGSYVDVYWGEAGDKVKKSLLRIPISQIVDTLTDYPQFYRTHRSYIVNLEKIRKVEGNARGLSLRVALFEEPVLVARSKIDDFRQLMQTRKETSGA